MKTNIKRQRFGEWERLGEKLAIFDADDVLLNWKEAYLDWTGELGWEVKPKEECTTWDMSTWFYPKGDQEMTPELSIRLIERFNGFPRVLAPLGGVSRVLESLRASGWDIKVLSSFGSCSDNNKFRRDYLNMLFPDIFSEIIILGLGECKKEKLRELKPDVFIEDNKSHAEKSLELGIKTYLISTPYNQGCEGAIYFKDWSEFDL